MADFYYKTAGEAWQAMVSQFTAFGQLAYASLGFSVVWTPGATETGGHFTVAVTVIAGEPYANGNYWAADSKTGGAMPLNAIVRQAGMDVGPQVIPLTDILALTALGLKEWLALARGDMLIDVTGCSVLYAYVMDSVLAGAGDPIVLRTVSALVTATDQAFDQTYVVDLNQQPATSPITAPVNPAYQTGGTVTINNIIQSPATYDIDQAINAGGSIYTVGSRQISGS